MSDKKDSDSKKRKLEGGDLANDSSADKQDKSIKPSGTVWDGADFADDERKRKFMRLMGGAKNTQQSNAAQNASQPTVQRKFHFDTSKVNADLEREFCTGMSRQLSGNRRACVGFSREDDSNRGTSSVNMTAATGHGIDFKRAETGSAKKNLDRDPPNEDEDEEDEHTKADRERKSEDQKQEKYAQFQFTYGNNSYGQNRSRGGSFGDRGRGGYGDQRGRGGYSRFGPSSNTTSVAPKHTKFAD